MIICSLGAPSHPHNFHALHPIKQGGKLRLGEKQHAQGHGVTLLRLQPRRLRNQAALPQHPLSDLHKPTYLPELQGTVPGRESPMPWYQLSESRDCPSALTSVGQLLAQPTAFRFPFSWRQARTQPFLTIQDTTSEFLTKKSLTGPGGLPAQQDNYPGNATAFSEPHLDQMHLTLE